MPFFPAALAAAAPAAGKALGAGAVALGGNFLGNAIGGRQQRGHSLKQTVNNNVQAEYSARRQFLWYEKQGLTEQEIMGSPAAGGVSSSSSSPQMMGNSQVGAQVAGQMFESKERDKDRQTELAKTAIQADASVRSSQIGAQGAMGAASISAQAMNFSSMVQQSIANDNRALEWQKFLQIARPIARAELGIKDAQLEQMANDLATSTPEFVTFLKQMSMGTENMAVSAIFSRMGINLSDPSTITSLSPAEMRNLVMTLAGMDSVAFKNAAGAAGVIDMTLSPMYNNESNQARTPY